MNRFRRVADLAVLAIATLDLPVATATDKVPAASSPKMRALPSSQVTYRLAERGGALAVDHFGSTARVASVVTGFEEATQKMVLEVADVEPLGGKAMGVVDGR